MTEAGSQPAGPSLELPRPRRGGGRRAAAVSLEGASASELRRTLALAGAYDRSPLLVAVDGGLATCRAVRRRPDLFVGDRDSSEGPPAGVPSRVYPADKDFSDFAGALAEIADAGAEVVVVAGLIGGRLDHEWANVAEIGGAARRFTAILAPTARGLVAVTARGLSARPATGSLVSVFAVHRGATVTLSGTSWTLTRRRLPPGSLGLSNVTEGRLSLRVHSGVVAVVFPETPPSPSPRARGRRSRSSGRRGARSRARA